MAGRSFTAAEITDRIRTIGRFRNLDGDYSADAPTQPSSGTMLQLIDLANAEAYEQWSAADEGWNAKRALLVASVNSASFYDLPSDCHRLRSVQYSWGGSSLGSPDSWEVLERANSADDRGYGTAAAPYAYREWPTQLEILSAGSSSSIRLTYCPVASRISQESDAIPGTDGYDMFVTYSVLAQLQEGLDEDPTGYRAQAMRYLASFSEAIRHRDRASPVRMQPRGTGGRRRPWPRDL